MNLFLTSLLILAASFQAHAGTVTIESAEDIKITGLNLHYRANNAVNPACYELIYVDGVNLPGMKYTNIKKEFAGTDQVTLPATVKDEGCRTKFRSALIRLDFNSETTANNIWFALVADKDEPTPPSEYKLFCKKGSCGISFDNTGKLIEIYRLPIDVNQDTKIYVETIK